MLQTLTRHAPALPLPARLPVLCIKEKTTWTVTDPAGRIVHRSTDSRLAAAILRAFLASGINADICSSTETTVHMIGGAA